MRNELAVGGASVRVMIVDDHPAVRQGLVFLLESEGITVCAAVETVAGALACVEKDQPDMALVDISLIDEDGTELIAELSARNLPCLAYSMHEDGRHVEAAFAGGARGYVTKREMHGVLVRAIGEVAAGGRFVSPRAAVALAEYAADRGAKEPQNELSNQEGQVYRLLGGGAGTTEIACVMGISTRTVESYFARIQVKMGLEGMRALRHHAIGRFRDGKA